MKTAFLIAKYYEIEKAVEVFFFFYDSAEWEVVLPESGSIYPSIQIREKVQLENILTEKRLVFFIGLKMIFQMSSAERYN